MEPLAPDPPHGAGCPLSCWDPSVSPSPCSVTQSRSRGDANILALLKKTTTLKEKKKIPSRVIQRRHVMCWHTNRSLGTAPAPLGTGHGSHATRGDRLRSAGDTGVPRARDVARWDFAPSAAPHPGWVCRHSQKPFRNRREIPKKSPSSPGWVCTPRHGQGDVAW